MFTTTAANIAAQRQASLFEEQPAAFELTSCPAPEKLTNGWRGLGGGPGGRHHAWQHTTGAVVRHCGHPTALRPYWVEGHAGGWKFRRLADAQAAALVPGIDGPEWDAAAQAIATKGLLK